MMADGTREPRKGSGSPRSCAAGLLGMAIALGGMPPGRVPLADAQSGGRGGKVEEITFDDVKLDLQKDEPFVDSKLTDRVKRLNKKSVRVRGWILPASVFQQKGIKSFVLVRDNMQCCFGPGAALFDCMVVEMEKGTFADFTTRPVAVEGLFEIKELKYPDGKQYAIYHVRGWSVK